MYVYVYTSITCMNVGMFMCVCMHICTYMYEYVTLRDIHISIFLCFFSYFFIFIFSSFFQVEILSDVLNTDRMTFLKTYTIDKEMEDGKILIKLMHKKDLSCVFLAEG